MRGGTLMANRWCSTTNLFQRMTQSTMRQPTHALEAAILRRIDVSDIVVVPTGMYSSYSKWIGKEIKGAVAKK